LQLLFDDQSMIRGEWTLSRTSIDERTIISGGVVPLRKTVDEKGTYWSWRRHDA
jgi:hypothetical protein